MSEDQAVSSPAVDVAALRAALEAATPGPWETGRDWAAIASGADSVIHGYVDTLCDSCGERVHGDAEVALSVEDAKLIVLLRNNAEALLRMLDDGYCAGYDHGVEDQMDRQARMEPDRWWRALDTDGDVWCESSSEDEVREMARPSDRVQRLYTSTAGEWRDQPEQVSP